VTEQAQAKVCAWCGATEEKASSDRWGVSGDDDQICPTCVDEFTDDDWSEDDEDDDDWDDSEFDVVDDPDEK